MNSKIYTGFVEHTRHLPVYHHFQYPVYMYGIDIDELPLLDKKLLFFGYNRLRPATINDADYLDNRPGCIKEKLLELLPEADRAQVATVMLITSARYFHYIFNPVCFYYCFDRRGEVVCLAAEVSNTYGERHVYLPKPSAPDTSGPGIRQYTAEKAFHVSPFNNMSGRYDFFCTLPGQTIDLAIHLVREGEKIFEARFQAKGRELTRAAHLGLLLRHPVMPHLTMPRIIFEAMRLYYRKHMPWHDKPAPSDPMTIRHKR
ncbi:MAG: DUF1365 domain-containing protein [Desulfosalsimonas sp.]|uniref:DUF1365 domain-containing protein n=1 Tax=Desulfosalsimonas sp. TaxID=3073848 RepID=UPI003970F1A7